MISGTPQGPKFYFQVAVKAKPKQILAVVGIVVLVVEKVGTIRIVVTAVGKSVVEEEAAGRVG